jgi:hypothetical protein
MTTFPVSVIIKGKERALECSYSMTMCCATATIKHPIDQFDSGKLIKHPHDVLKLHQ